MGVLTTILTILYVVVCLVLIFVVLMQSGKSEGLSGSIAGGADTFFGKNKGRSIDAKLEKWTVVVAVLFIVLSVALVILSTK